MEEFNQILRLIDVNVIQCLIPIILTLFVTEKLFKNKFQTKEGLQVVVWIIITFTALEIIRFLSGIIFYPEEMNFLGRGKGPYKFTYWFMLVCTFLLPFSLFHKRLCAKYGYVILVSFLMKAGTFFEKFVIWMTALHRNYLPDKYPDTLNLGLYTLLALSIQGVFIAILILAVLKLNNINPEKNVKNKHL